MAGPQQDPLQAARETVQRDLAKLPNYLCTETIEQSERCTGCAAPERRGKSIEMAISRFRVLNRVRLDVGYANRKQIFGWTGGDSLSEEEISRLVPGLVSDGDLLTLSRLLLTSSAVFTRVGDEELRGRSTFRYEYRVPVESSMWVLRYAGGNAVVGYHGSLWIDKSALEPVELDIRADGVPASFGFEAVERELQYARTQIGSNSFLLPQRATVLTTNLWGVETKSNVRFDVCRQYTAESTVHFFPPEDSIAERGIKRSPRVVRLPSQFEADLSLDADIGPDTAAVGDPVTARLVKDCSRAGVTIPKGAIFGGRITDLDFVAGFIDIAFNYIQASSKRIDIGNRRNKVVHIDGTRLFVPRGYRFVLSSVASSENLQR